MEQGLRYVCSVLQRNHLSVWDFDSYAVSEEIYRRFYEGYSEVALPHKFKIAVGAVQTTVETRPE